MSHKRLARFIGATLAIFAMLLASLAPAVTSALVAANEQHVRWMVVCTGAGARLVPVPADADGVPVVPGARHVDHCPFCAPGAVSLALPPTASIALPLVAGHDPVTPPAFPAPRPRSPWTAAQPRAPPSAS